MTDERQRWCAAADWTLAHLFRLFRLLRLVQLLLDEVLHGIETRFFGSNAVQSSLKLNSGKAAEVQRRRIANVANPAQCSRC